MSEASNTFDDKGKDGQETVGGVLVQSEKLGFERSELLYCAKCARTNSPDRFECIYCGTVLGIDHAKDGVSIDRTPPELWEKGFNIILVAGSAAEVNIAKAAKTVGLEAEIFTDLLRADRPLPLLRLKSLAEAEAISERLSELGLKQKIVADADLRSMELPVRLRGLEFAEDRLQLIDFNTSERIDIGCADIELIVVGRSFSTRTEVSEERRKKKDPKVLSETETSTDDLLIDMYIRGNELGYRISSIGFDFSCLRFGKGMLVAENMKKLAAKLSQTAFSAKYVDDYAGNVDRLSNVWKLESRKDRFGLQRSGFGRTAFESVATSNNIDQFTKFSRMNRILNEA